jgi:hypothetical protein
MPGIEGKKPRADHGGLLAQLGGHHAIVLDERGDVDEGEGMRVLLLPDFLLVEVKVDGNEGHSLIPIHEILQGMMRLAKEVGS